MPDIPDFLQPPSLHPSKGRHGQANPLNERNQSKEAAVGRPSRPCREKQCEREFIVHGRGALSARPPAIDAATFRVRGSCRRKITIMNRCGSHSIIVTYHIYAAAGSSMMLSERQGPHPSFHGAAPQIFDLSRRQFRLRRNRQAQGLAALEQCKHFPGNPPTVGLPAPSR